MRTRIDRLSLIRKTIPWCSMPLLGMAGRLLGNDCQSVLNRHFVLIRQFIGYLVVGRLLGSWPETGFEEIGARPLHSRTSFPPGKRRNDGCDVPPTLVSVTCA